MGYYDCYEQFKYLHISHYGQFMPDDVTKNKMSKILNILALIIICKDI